MDFDWSKPFSEEVEGELPDIHIGSDKLDRGKYAEFLTEFLSSLDNQNYVMNLDAEWGAGKTYFLQRWYHTIKENHPAVYIDAWTHDFSDEPLLAVISAITNYFKEKSPETGAQKAKELAGRSWRFSKKIAPELVRGLTKKLSGVDISKISSDDPIDSVSDIKLDGDQTNGIEDFSLLAGKAFEVALADHSEKVEEMEFFKISIRSWLKEIVAANVNLNLPMFVFIDELDRCRPTYAIELLETVKHLFDIEGVIFVITTDTGQLQHSIKAVYGEGFDSSKYLYRFFDRSFSLKKPEIRDFICSQEVFNEHLLPNLRSTCNGNLLCEEQQVIDNFTTLAEAFSLDLRTVTQWLDRIWAVVNTQEKRDKYIWIYLAFLTAIKVRGSECFSDCFIQFKYTESFGVAKLHDLQQRYSALSDDFKMKNWELNFSIRSTVTSEPGSAASPRFNSADYIAVTPNVSFNLVGRINQIMSSEFKWEALGWNNINADKKELLPMLYFHNKQEYSVQKQNYVNLVEMASDLT